MILIGPKGERHVLRVWACVDGPMPTDLSALREPDEDDVADWLAAHPGWRREQVSNDSHA